MEIKASSEKLLNIDLVRRRFLKVAFSGSHGADGEDLGAGLLYYAMAKAVRARVCVCIGSGGGFVPGLMAQAQNDCGYAADCCTYLVDAVLPELAFGSPLQSGGWLANGNDLLIPPNAGRAVAFRRCRKIICQTWNRNRLSSYRWRPFEVWSDIRS